MVGNFNIPLSALNRPGRQKISKDIVELNNIINQMDIIDIYTLVHLPTTAEHTFFSSSCGIFTR